MPLSFRFLCAKFMQLVLPCLCSRIHISSAGRWILATVCKCQASYLRCIQYSWKSTGRLSLCFSCGARVYVLVVSKIVLLGNVLDIFHGSWGETGNFFHRVHARVIFKSCLWLKNDPRCSDFIRQRKLVGDIFRLHHAMFIIKLNK